MTFDVKLVMPFVQLVGANALQSARFGRKHVLPIPALWAIGVGAHVRCANEQHTVHSPDYFHSLGNLTCEKDALFV